jgi:hypothetical protein
MEPEVRRAVPPGTALLIELNHPARAFDSRFGKDLWTILRESSAVRQSLDSPDIERLRQSARFLETTLEVDWHTALSQLTEGGVVIAVHPAKSGKQPDVTVVVSSDNEQTLKRVLDAIHETLRRRAQGAAVAADPARPAAVKPPEPVSTTFRSFSCHRVGNGHYAVAGRRLLVANRQEVLEEALSRMSDPEISDLCQPPESLQFPDFSGREPLILMTLNLKLARQDPGTLEKLKFPMAEWVPVVLAGGYLDLLRRADFVSAGLFADDRGAELRVRFPAGAEGALAGLRGYFATEAGEAAAPLLRPTGTLFSMSWFRDYARIWNARSELCAPQLVKKIDSDNIRQREVAGGPGLGDLTQLLGSHYRVVAARQQESAYQSPPAERAPAFALVVDVPDEQKFREQALAPIDRFVQLSVVPLAGEIRPAEYRGAKLTTVRFDGPEQSSPRERRHLLNFDPAFTLTRGHLILGSTSEIVRAVIDELERHTEIPDTIRTGPGQTHEFQCSLPALADALNLFRGKFVRQIASDRKLTSDEAERELEVLRRFLSRLGQLSSRSNLGPQQFDFVLRVGADPDRPADPSGSR